MDYIWRMLLVHWCWFTETLLKLYWFFPWTFSGQQFYGWFKYNIKGFPGAAVAESPPANAGDMGLSPGPGGSCMPRSNWARAPQLLRLHSEAQGPRLLSPRATTAEAHAPRAPAPQQEKPPQWEACALQWRVASALRNWRKACVQQRRPNAAKNYINK